MEFAVDLPKKMTAEYVMARELTLKTDFVTALEAKLTSAVFVEEMEFYQVGQIVLPHLLKKLHLHIQKQKQNYKSQQRKMEVNLKEQAFVSLYLGVVVMIQIFIQLNLKEKRFGGVKHNLLQEDFQMLMLMLIYVKLKLQLKIFNMNIQKMLKQENIKYM